jgi:phage-related minor tail protein
MTTRNLGSLVVKLALELSQYKTDWRDAEASTAQGAAKVDQASRGAAQAADALKDALKRQTGAFGEAAAGAGELASGTGALTGVSTAAAAGVTAVAAAVVAVGVAAVQGYKEQKQLNDALLLTGNYAGLVSGELDRMALSVAASIGGTVGSSREVLAGLVATGRFTVESLEAVSQAVLQVARYSGQSEQQVLQHFAGMADGVAKWAAKANESYHFLDLATYNYITRLEEQGEKQQAARVASEALSRHLGSDLSQNLGLIERAWHAIERAASGAWAAMKDIGKPTSNSQKLQELDAYIARAQSGLMGRSAGGQEQLRMLQQQADQLRALVDAERTEAQAKSDQAQANEKAIKVQERWNKQLETAPPSRSA